MYSVNSLKMKENYINKNESRLSREDLATTFECNINQIATTPEEVNKDTKVYVGKLYSDIFHQNIQHIYTNYPEGKVEIKKIDTGGKTKSEYKKELKEQEIKFTTSADALFERMKLAQEQKKSRKLALISLEGLDLGEKATTKEIYNRAEELGLQQVSNGSVFDLILKENFKYGIKVMMTQVETIYDKFEIFYVVPFGKKCRVQTLNADPEDVWPIYQGSEGKWLFELKETK